MTFTPKDATALTILARAGTLTPSQARVVNRALSKNGKAVAAVLAGGKSKSRAVTRAAQQLKRFSTLILP